MMLPVVSVIPYALASCEYMFSLFHVFTSVLIIPINSLD